MSAETSSSPSPRMPGDFLQTPDDANSGYNSSNEDHFSDAPEPADEDPSEEVEKKTSDDKESQSDDAASTAPNSDLATDESPNQIPPTIVTPIESFPRDNAETPAVIVKWNEEANKIRRKVKSEKARIERLMQQERSRSRSPVSLVSVSSISASHSPARKSEDHEVLQSEEDGISIVPPEPLLVSENAVTPASPSLSIKSVRIERRLSNASTSSETRLLRSLSPGVQTEQAESAEDDFGDDDFDDFGEAVAEDGDFDDFDGFEEAEATTFEAVTPPPPAPTISEPPVSILDLGAEDIGCTLSDAMEKMFPGEKVQTRSGAGIESRPFLTERSLSLWNQLVAPPPLQPPNWKVSRIRRLFLVSLGVPIDLDEILPAETKQKKLVLPSVHPPRRSFDDRSPSGRNSRSHSRSRSKKSGENDKGIRPEALDISSARILCSTSDVKLQNFTIEELRAHIQKLKETTDAASAVLTYWLKKRNSAQGDKETFETVIESLVGYARKKRQNG